MKRFLLLTGLVTVSIGLGSVMVGCSSKSEDAGPAPHEEQQGTSPADEKETPAASSSGSNPTPANSPDAGTKADSGDANKDGGGEGGTGPVACLDDNAPAVQPNCPANGECDFACTEFATAYKKGLSADIRKCLTAQLCETSTASCADKALAKACADPTAAAFCTPMVTGCKAANGADTITQASCETVAKGLNATGRNIFKNCFETQANCGDCVPMMK